MTLNTKDWCCKPIGRQAWVVMPIVLSYYENHTFSLKRKKNKQHLCTTETVFVFNYTNI